MRSNCDDLLVRPLPLFLGGVALDALDEHSAVPAAVEHAHPAEPGDLAEEAAKEVVTLLVGRRRRVRLHGVVAGIEVLDDALDRPALAAGVATFEDDEQARTDLARNRARRRDGDAVAATGAGPTATAPLVLAPPEPLARGRAGRVCVGGSPPAMLRGWRNGYEWDSSAADRGPSASTPPSLAAHPDFDLTGVWTRRPAAAAELAAATAPTAFDDFGALIDAVDVVALSVPPAVQAELAVEAARAGRHLILEKPIAASLDGARRLADASSTAGVASIVVLTFRFAPETREWLADVAAGGPWSGGNARWLSGGLLGGEYAGSPWRQEHGAILDIGPHLFDLLDAALGPIVEVRAALFTRARPVARDLRPRQRAQRARRRCRCAWRSIHRCSSSTSTAAPGGGRSPPARRRRSSASPRFSTSWRTMIRAGTTTTRATFTAACTCSGHRARCGSAPADRPGDEFTDHGVTGPRQSTPVDGDVDSLVEEAIMSFTAVAKLCGSS